MKILTWNVNGLRSLKGDLAVMLDDLSADIVCFQETKITRDMLEEPLALVQGWSSYFAFSRKRTGYSGVATFCRTHVTPIDAQEGLTYPSADLPDLATEFSSAELKDLEAEGRAVVTVHQLHDDRTLALFNLYCPRADPERADRLAFKYNFYKLVELRAHHHLRQGHHVLIVGDVNTSHRSLDHCDPYEEFEMHPGRQWLDHLLFPPNPKTRNTPVQVSEDEEQPWACLNVQLEPHQFVDTFRHFHPERANAFTCWNTKMNCRSTNYGTRIDYILADRGLIPHLGQCDIHPEIEGSDHCPVKCELNVTVNFPEFAGQQQKLSQFLQVRSKRSIGVDEPAVPPKKVKVEKPTQKTLHSFFQKTVKETKIVLETHPSSSPEPVVQVQEWVEQRTSSSALAWKALFKGPPPAPQCKGHNEKAILRTVKKKGPNAGRQFWCCGRGEGKADDPQARCDFFKWVK
ncbi:hypothetical protein TCAL_11626 [Tigriopus californicus]|uniref:DNA-(apurinic or apyrimidinic site) endonuclease n=1 Tax=Tigriopus californicus TaxID=6832 RepID=A0A553NYP5_TIGCA|nr:hypothetical protein TCAL_11626 [Tigriopus californicus]|eukprot:TCALIF_11626-PA protein Name:"Similar to Apex2 DNA-(apurinic or apyrimidinic site) lyase 2 (Mus musculus)" AED:0.07 eAED:0.07 QI:83/0.75/0.6/1/0.75/0.4/5/0/458